MPAFSIPLSGLSASSEALSTISNNLANLNTVGYKDQNVSFRDLFYQTVGSTGSGNPVQIGAGVAVSSVSSIFTGSAVQSTGVPTDVAISGDGFFITEQNGAMQFTRAGNFDVDEAGQLVTVDGRFVMGYPAVGGVITPGQGLSPIQLSKGQLSPPSATASFNMRTNLDASAQVGDSYSAPITVYDSLGVQHVLTIQYTKSAANTWTYSATVPATDVGGAASDPATVVGSGTLNFDPSGKLVGPVDSNGKLAAQTVSLNNLTSGANPMTISWMLANDAGAPLISQAAAASSTSATNQDGYGSGSLLSFSFGSDGLIQGSFSNGQTKPVGQLALAQFANVQGLERQGNNQFAQTLASGAPVIGAPGSGGRGTLTGGALELSNVDISQEFSKMIINQRAFQANAKVVTAFDEITQDTINMKR